MVFRSRRFSPRSRFRPPSFSSLSRFNSFVELLSLLTLFSVAESRSFTSFFVSFSTLLFDEVLCLTDGADTAAAAAVTPDDDDVDNANADFFSTRSVSFASANEGNMKHRIITRNKIE